MFKVLVPIAAAVIYAAANFVSVPATVAVCLVVIGISFGVFVWGLRTNYRHPSGAARAIEGWTVAWIVLLAPVGIFVAWLGVRIKEASPDTASGDVKTLAALGAAVLAVLLGWLVDWKPAWSSAGRSKAWLKDSLTTRFPAQPQKPPEAVLAWQAVDNAVFHAGATWNVGFRRDLFTVVKAAVDAGGYFGGVNWQPANPPPAAPNS